MQLKKQTIVEWMYTTEKGVEIPLKDMTHEHLVNAFAKASYTLEMSDEPTRVLKEELLRRLRLKS